MNRFQILLFVLLFLFSAFKSDKPAYLLYTKEGKTVKYSKMLKELEDADVVLFGELHNSPISHWLELEITKDLYAMKEDNLILAAEMFETDNQLILSEYIDSMITTSRFEDEAKLWPNYKTDYKPLVEFARKNKLQFVASNVPRRYASLVNSKGFEGLEELTDEAKTFLPPLPIKYDPELNCYKSMMEMEGMGAHVTPNFPKAQAIKDATMAHSILQFWKPGKQMIHYHGAYHSENFESIYWYLKQANPNLNIVTIHSVSQADNTKLTEKNTGKADYTICVDEDMTSTR
ncbi:ChaN family lipoprotein [Maribellus maritimus]|uniref:ChaN family lipoprotein n=1 Tax=Maribellus maritimus TaxID=2870838 RepID=UPI001EEBE024|nr:ChaN family lipoprotein [Maribellus maritimus]MCG6186480.1 ChaN family lipoprotein [Maribellus maritimus]